MPHPPLGSYLRSHRKRAGLSQRQLAEIFGYESRTAISRYECSNSLPPLETMLAYQAIFGTPVSDLFPCMYHTIRETIEAQVADLETALQNKSAHDRDATATARVLEWITERKLDLEF